MRTLPPTYAIAAALLIIFSSSESLALDVTVSDCSETGLAQAVQAVTAAGSGTIQFACPAGTVIRLTSHKKFSGKGGVYVLDGGGLVTLDGQGKTRLLYSQPGDRLSLTVKNIILSNGYAGSDSKSERAANQGGAIYSGYFNSLSVENAHFLNNRALAERNGYHGGGAIAIDSESTAQVSNCTFTGNIAPSGGAINGLRTDLTIRQSVFQGNTSTNGTKGGGGAVYNDGGKITLIDSLILNNRAVILGGGMFDWANKYKGAKHSGPTLIENCVFAGNEAKHGGAFWKGGNRLLVMNKSSIIGNTAVKIGGGISGTGPGPNFQITNSTISGNRVLHTGSAGGIYNGGSSSTVINSTVAWNTVPNDGGSVGGGIHSGKKGLTLKNSLVAYNTGGWNKVRGCFGRIKNGGGNLQYPSNTCGRAITEVDPQLQNALVPALTEMAAGGKTPLHTLFAGSPAVRLGTECPATDQHGTAREATGCDSGAFEQP